MYPHYTLPPVQRFISSGLQQHLIENYTNKKTFLMTLFVKHLFFLYVLLGLVRLRHKQPKHLLHLK